MAGFAVGGLSDLTKKQSEMATARSPLNNNEINLSTMEERQKKQGVLSDTEMQKEAQKQTGTTTRKGVTGATAQAVTPYQTFSKDLGSFTDRVNAEVAKFLSTGAGGLGVTADYSPQFVAGKGYVAGSGDVTLDASKVAEQKLSQLGGIQEQLSPYMVDNRFKKFEDVLEKFGDTNKDGTIDPVEQENINRAFNVVNQIRRLNNLAAGPEREALMMQLQEQDRDGLVTGILSAMETYDQLTGSTVSGAGAKSFGIGDVLTMGLDDLTKEVEAAAVGKESLFGGTMAADLKKEMDTSATAYRKTAVMEAEAMNNLLDMSEELISGYEQSLKENRGKINDLFRSSVQGVIEDLDKVAAAEGNPEWVQRAKDWFVQTSQGSEADGTDFATALQEMMSSEYGLAPEVREIFQRYLDQTLGGAAGQSGLAKTLQTLAKTGRLEVVDANGVPTYVPMTMNDKMYVSQVASDTSLTAAEKQSKIQDLIDKKIAEKGLGLKENLQTIQGLIEGGKLKESAGLFRTSLVNSLKTYKDSFTDQLYQAAKSSGATPETIKGAMEQSNEQYLKDIQTAADRTIKELKKQQETAIKDQDEIGALIKLTDAKMTEGGQVLRNNLMTSIQNGVPQYASAIQTYLASKGKPADERMVNVYANSYSLLRVMDSIKKSGDPAAMSMYGQIEARFGATPNVFTRLVANPVNLMNMGEAEAQMLMQAINSIRYVDAFKQTQQYQELNNLRTNLNNSQKEAMAAVVGTNALMTEINVMTTKAQADVAKFTSDAANKIFSSAKSGLTVDLGDKSGVSQQDLLSRKYDYVEDPTTRDSLGSMDSLTRDYAGDVKSGVGLLGVKAPIDATIYDQDGNPITPRAMTEAEKQDAAKRQWERG